MRHSKKRHKLGVSGPHRLALLANLSIALITHGRIKTTLAKAKALRPFIEKIITMAKKAKVSNEAERKLHFRRLAISRLNNPAAVAKLFDDRVSEFMERPGGYTRIYKLGQRIGDAAEMALIELIDGNDEGYTKSTSKKKASPKPVEKLSEKTETKASEVSTGATAETPVDEEVSAEEGSAVKVETPVDDSGEPSAEADEMKATSSEDTEEEK